MKLLVFVFAEPCMDMMLVIIMTVPREIYIDVDIGIVILLMTETTYMCVRNSNFLGFSGFS